MKKCDNCGNETDENYSYNNMLICDKCRRKLEKHYTKVAKGLGRVFPSEKYREMYKEDLKGLK